MKVQELAGWLALKNPNAEVAFRFEDWGGDRWCWVKSSELSPVLHRPKVKSETTIALDISGLVFESDDEDVA